MKVIAVGGQLASGKDSISDYLAGQLNKRYRTPSLWRRIGFANAVKKVYMDTFNVSWDFVEEWKRKDEIPPGFATNVRKSLQFIGDGFRQIQSDIWIQLAFREDVPKVISDLRYINEGRVCREHGGLNILVWRPGFENDDPNPSEAQIKPTVDWFAASGFEGDVRKHQLPDLVSTPKDTGRITAYPSLFDFFIRNEGTKEELLKKIDDLVIPAVEAYYGAIQG